MSTDTRPLLPFIRKRDGRIELFDSRKAVNNLSVLSWGLDMRFIDLSLVIDSLERRLPSDVMDAEAFQTFLAEVVSTFSSHHPDYSILAGRVYTAYIHKRVTKRFSTWVEQRSLVSDALFSDTLVDIVGIHADAIDSAIMHHRDFDFTYRALQTFERSYLIREGRLPVERVQFMYMRVAIGIHGQDISNVMETYECLSTHQMSFASPVLWNGGLSNRAFASCYIFDPFVAEPKDALNNLINLSSLWAFDGGIGIHAGNVPSMKAGRDDNHPGLLPLLKLYDSLASYWSRTSRHRSASATVCLPIWHSDVRPFVQVRTNRAASEYRFRHIFPTLWIPDLFMQRLESDGDWSLFDPADVIGLTGLVGDAFVAAYETYEHSGIATAFMPARVLWDVITGAQRESGSPFIMFSDNINSKNNQMHMGVIKASNLCTEIVQFSSPTETAVCILGAVCLPRFVHADGSFDFVELHRVSKAVVRDLDKLIDIAQFPTADAAVSAYDTRSIGLGTQGLADVFASLGLPFTSPQAKALNIQIFETICHAALDSSCELAERFGPYDRWTGSAAASETSGRYDFDALRARIQQFGLRNSMLTAQMPTASTAQLLRSSEGIEPYTSNVVQYRILSGTYNELSPLLVGALTRRNLWNDQLRSSIIASHGSVQNIGDVPADIKDTFRTAFELDPQELIQMSADRAPFIDQSQSFSLFIAHPTSRRLMDLALHAWKLGLKTGVYYVRSKPAVELPSFGAPSDTSDSTVYFTPAFTVPVLPSGPECPCDV